MKIGIVTEYFYPTLGGITENIYHFSRELLRLGHDFRIITGKGDDPGGIDPEVKRRMIFLGRSIPVFFNGSCGRATVGIGLTRKMREVLGSEGFDIIHAHSPVFPTLPMIANLQANAPVVGTFHTCTGRNLIYYRAYRKSAQNLIDRMAGRIAVSECCARENNSFFKGHFDVIPNGVDVCWWTDGAKRIPRFDDGTVNVLFLGRPDTRNGLDTLIAAFARVHRARPRTRLIVVGDGPLRFHFERQVPEEAKKAVFFEGAASDSRPDYLATADIFCFLPTIASFGVTILEGMSAGRAIIASDIEAFRDLLKHEESALLCPPGDVDALSASILRLVDDPQLREKTGVSARAHVGRYDWPRVAVQHIEYYNRILGGTRTGD